MLENPSLQPLAPGDRVFFEGYGVGVVEDVGAFRMWIVWERAGRLDHDLSFARWLKPAR